MAKLYYWIANHKSDSGCYSAIGRTKKDCVAWMNEFGGPNGYEPPVRKVIYYNDAFSLFAIASGEGGRNGAGLDVKREGA